MDEKKQCRSCSKSFPDRGALDQHINAVHQQPAEPAPKPKLSIKKELAKRKGSLIGLGILLGLIAFGVVLWNAGSGVPSGLGSLGSAHDHVGIIMQLDGERVDLGQAQFQLQDQRVHLEGGDPTTIHAHATGIPFSMFFDTLGIEIENECITVSGRQYCTNEDKELQVYINGQRNLAYLDYRLSAGGRILVWYGEDDPTEIQRLQSQIQVNINPLNPAR